MSTQLTDLFGVGPARARDLERAGIATPEDLLTLRPLRWEDRSHKVALADLRSLPSGSHASLAVEVLESRLIRTRRRGFTLVRARVTDGCTVMPVVWFNQPYLARHLRPGRHLWLFGGLQVARSGGERLGNPEVEFAGPAGSEDEAIHTARIVPVYRRLGALSGRMLRRLIHDLLATLPETLPESLPEEVRRDLDLPRRRAALRHFHFPPTGTPAALLEMFATPAQRRLVFEELYLLCVAREMKRAARRSQVCGARLRLPAELVERLRDRLPFRLTPGQDRAFASIARDLRGSAPMARLVQGDVGSGKTAVALLAMLAAVANGSQAVLMAPTEVLAGQHQLSLTRLLGPAGPTVELLTSGLSAAERRRVIEGLAAGTIHLIVGTHALIQADVTFRHLALVVIDEQHRFGVAQRLDLARKGTAPHLLVMTATPIPRSLALTVYGDLDRSEIRDRPPGRRPVRTVAVPRSEAKRVWALVRRATARGRQAYIVVPLVEESDKMELTALEAAYDELASGPLAGVAMERLHGRLPVEEREAVMSRFAAGRTRVLVATTVIEVGVDIRNAAVLVVVDAERFGLAQLHQLRGRVGRGAHRSACILLVGPRPTPAAHHRLKVLCRCQDGFEIARQDLALRGPGELLGTRQAGATDLRIADLVRDEALLERARAEAAHRAPAGLRPATRQAAVRRWGPRLGLLEAG